jgi:uracil-DNA glycosylase
LTFTKQSLLPVNEALSKSIVLEGQVDLLGFRRAARDLVASNISPDRVSWHSSGAPIEDLFADSVGSVPKAQGCANSPVINVPAEFLTLCQTVILHSNLNRFGLMYRLLWRLQKEAALRYDSLDGDWIQAKHLAQAVRRDMHKMKAFVRFRAVEDDAFKNDAKIGALHIAWFEPEHHIVEATAPFFVRRFTQMRWVIMTPACSVEWRPSLGSGSGSGSGSGIGSLHTGPGAQKSDAPPADAGEALWLTYYQHIFNPARLKLKMMQKEMPKRYWKNLPEAQFISELKAASAQRSLSMIDQAPTTPRRRIPPSEGTAAALRKQSAGDVLQTLEKIARGEHPLNLAALNKAVQACRACPIGEQATQAVCGEGPPSARVMIVGEQPGDQEDLRGRPLVGPSGHLFDRALIDLKWRRKDLFITNAVKHFKYEIRGKRRMHKTASQQEAAACLHWLESEIELVKPELAIALGATAAMALLGRKVAIMSARGKCFTRPDGLRVLVTLHPAALLRMPIELQAAAYVEWTNDLTLASHFVNSFVHTVTG